MADSGHTEEHKEQQDSPATDAAAEKAAAPLAGPDAGKAGAEEKVTTTSGSTSVSAPVPATSADDAHAADDHGHGHDDHAAAPADIIPEKSWQDSLLSLLAMGVLASFIWLVYYWGTNVPLATVQMEEHSAGNPSTEAPR
jgi:hypothetical protein